MREWQKLAVAGIAVIGAAAVATPASAAPAGLQTLEFTSASVDRPEVLPVGNRHNKHWRHRRHNDGINLSFGVFPFIGGYGYGGGYPYYGGGYGYGGPYRSNYYYADDGYDDSWLHCHGKRYWKHGKRRCTGKWHRHYN